MSRLNVKHLDVNSLDHIDNSPSGSREEYMNSREAASYLHVKHRTLLEWARKGIVPAIPLGGGAQRTTWLFMRSAIDQAMRAKMTMNRPCSKQETKYVN